MHKPKLASAAGAVALALVLATGLGAGPAQAQPDRLAQDSLAQHHVVFQIDQGNGFTQRIVLNNVSNMLKHYGPDLIQIEVVAYGPGLRLLFEDNPNSKRIKGLVKQGVTFSACANTMNKMKKKMDDLVDGARKVPGGVVQIMERQEQGWAYIRP
ncbi:MAG TPA: DsrE family protein [Gammaproteobacteria bacterium]|nr:DsrE family protein [Gammaproteobacteria bacterium]